MSNFVRLNESDDQEVKQHLNFVIRKVNQMSPYVLEEVINKAQ